MRAVDIIIKKCDKHELTLEEIEFFVRGFTNKFYALISKLLGAEKPFELTVSNSANSRGELQPGMPPGGTLLASLASLPDRVAAALPDDEGELVPSGGELKAAKVAFLVDNRPGELVRVEILKGAVEIQDGSGARHVLRTGQVFQWRWGEKLSKADTILLRVDRRLFAP